MNTTTTDIRRRVAERALTGAGVTDTEAVIDGLARAGYSVVPDGWLTSLDDVHALADELEHAAAVMRETADALPPGTAHRAGAFGKHEGLEGAAERVRELAERLTTARVAEIAAIALGGPGLAATA